MTAWAPYAGLPPLAIIGHRGVRGARPENTLAAIEQAHDEGADGVEIDVRPCRSGQLVVIHDRDLARVTEGRDGRLVSGLSARELGAVDLGGGAGVPRLDDVLALCRARGLWLNVEMKRDVPDRQLAVRRVAEELAEADGVRFVVSSFDPAMLAALGRLAPALPRALLVHDTPRHRPLGWLQRPLRAVAVHPAGSMVTARRMRRWRARGVRVFVWTVNDAAEGRRLAGLGVDGIITDTPAAMRQAVSGR